MNPEALRQKLLNIAANHESFTKMQSLSEMKQIIEIASDLIKPQYYDDVMEQNNTENQTNIAIIHYERNREEQKRARDVVVERPTTTEEDHRQPTKRPRVLPPGSGFAFMNNMQQPEALASAGRSAEARASAALAAVARTAEARAAEARAAEFQSPGNADW
jgi:hypothetical protein